MKSIWWLESSSFSNSTGCVFTLRLNQRRWRYCWMAEAGGNSLRWRRIASGELSSSEERNTKGSKCTAAASLPVIIRGGDDLTIRDTSSDAGMPSDCARRMEAATTKATWREFYTWREQRELTVASKSIAWGNNLLPDQNLLPFLSMLSFYP